MTDFWDAPPPPPPEDALRSDLIQMIVDRYRVTPRHQQVELGPSEIGHLCLRRLAYGLTNAQQSNPYFDPLPSIIGTAAHTWMESAARAANEPLYEEFARECDKEPDPETRMFKLDTFKRRWLTETKVEIVTGLSGTCDLYDTTTNTVIDWKFPGASRFTAYRKAIPLHYRTQVHLYGKGFVRAGYPVKTVAICLLPRGGSLNSMHLWSEPYDEKLADEAIARREMVIALCNDWDVENNPDRYHWFATSPSDCMFCPQFSPRPVGPLQCKGDQ